MNEVTIQSFYYAIFICIIHMFVLHGVRIWTLNITNLLQKKATQIISFAHYDAHTLPIFAKWSIIKFSDLISLCNCLFIYKHFISKPASVFSPAFILASNSHKTLDLHHMVFWQNQHAILQNMVLMVLLLLL